MPVIAYSPSRRRNIRPAEVIFCEGWNWQAKACYVSRLPPTGSEENRINRKASTWQTLKQAIRFTASRWKKFLPSWWRITAGRKWESALMSNASTSIQASSQVWSFWEKRLGREKKWRRCIFFIDLDASWGDVIFLPAVHGERPWDPAGRRHRRDVGLPWVRKAGQKSRHVGLSINTSVQR